MASFTAAGRELGMSQAAVSYAIKGLEKQLGVSLFQRRHRQVGLTEAGERFFADVTLGLSHIRKSAEELQGAGRRPACDAVGIDRLRIVLDGAAAAEIPRRAARHRPAHPDRRPRPRPRRGRHSARHPRRRGRATGRTTNCCPSPPKKIYAVARPGLCRAFGHAARRVAEPANQRLIHLEEPFGPAATWNEWFQSAGIDGARRQSRPAASTTMSRSSRRSWRARAWRSAGATSPTAW